MVALLQGLEKKDKTAITSARTRLIVVLAHIKGQGLESEYTRRMVAELGLQPGQEAEFLELWTIESGRAAKIEWLFSGVLSDALDSVRLVLWRTRNQFRPALYCPDPKAALFTFILMRVVAGKGWGVCPHCGDFFVRKTPRPDLLHCCTSRSAPSCTVAGAENFPEWRWKDEASEGGA